VKNLQAADTEHATPYGISPQRGDHAQIACSAEPGGIGDQFRNPSGEKGTGKPSSPLSSPNALDQIVTSYIQKRTCPCSPESASRSSHDPEPLMQALKSNLVAVRDERK
jgi:hypothetical protein